MNVDVLSVFRLVTVDTNFKVDGLLSVKEPTKETDTGWEGNMKNENENTFTRLTQMSLRTQICQYLHWEKKRCLCGHNRLRVIRLIITE